MIFVIILHYLESRTSSFRKHIYTFRHLRRCKRQMIKKPKGSWSSEFLGRYLQVLGQGVSASRVVKIRPLVTPGGHSDVAESPLDAWGLSCNWTRRACLCKRGSHNFARKQATQSLGTAVT